MFKTDLVATRAIYASRLDMQMPGALVIGVVAALSLASCGGSQHPARSAVPANVAAAGRALGNWSNAVVGYDSVLDSCGTAVTPSRDYWPRCVRKQRREYVQATASLRRAVAGLSTTATCADATAKVSRLAVAMTTTFARALAALDFAQRNARSRHPQTGKGVSPVALWAHAHDAREAEVRREPALEHALLIACGQNSAPQQTS